MEPARWERANTNTEGGKQLYFFFMPNETASYSIEGLTFPVQIPPKRNDIVRVAWVADMAMTGNSKRVLDGIRAANVSMVLAGGDLSYADGRTQVCDDWFNFIQASAPSVPWMPARGNHEARCVSPQGLGASNNDCTTDERMYLFRFVRQGLLYYSFDWGPLRVISLDTEAYHARAASAAGPSPVNTNPGGQQEFVREQLRNVAGTDVWSVVMFHRPLYSSSRAHRRRPNSTAPLT